MGKITDLMKLFKDPDAYDNDNFPEFSKRKYDLKNTEEGVLELSIELQQVIDNEKNIAWSEGEKRGRESGRAEGKVEGRAEGRREGQQETKILDIKSVMESFGVSVEKAMESLKIPQNQRSMYSDMIAND